MSEFFRNSAFSPILVCGFCLALAHVLGARRWQLPWKPLSLLLLVALSLAALAYLVLPVLAEDTETDIGAIASLALRGLPVYPAPNAAARYILLYGPLTYLAHIPFYVLSGATLFSFKLLGFLAFLLTLLSLYRLARVFAPASPSLIGCGCACLLLLRYVPIPFWGRIDSLLLGLVALAYWLAVAAPTPVSVTALALAIGIVPNLKFTAVLYLLPLLLWIWMKRGPRPAILAALLGALLLPLPFLLPVVSFSNYLYVLHVVGRHGLDGKILLRNLQYVPILLAPVLLLHFARNSRTDPDRKQQTLYLLVLAACMLMSAIFGAKAGAGSYHLLPYLPPLLHLYFWVRSSSQAADPDLPFARFAAAWALTLLLFSAGQIRILTDCLRFAPRGREVTSQIAEAEMEYAGRALAIGPGGSFTDPRTLYALLPVLRGQPYIINPSAVRDLQFGGIELPPSTLSEFDTCHIPVWLIPAGQQPFSALNTYYKQPHPAFPDALRQIFLSRYRKVQTGPAFDIWLCGR